MFTVKVPKPPVLAWAWLLLTVGLWLVLQQTPRAVTVPPPALVTLPLAVALVRVMFVTCNVVTVGNATNVVKLTTLLYAVPALFVA